MVSETNGSWGNAIEVPGTATLNGGGDARCELDFVPRGRCVRCRRLLRPAAMQVIGAYQPFVVRTRRSGVWGNAITVPGTVPLNTGSDAAVNSISCAAAGECAAGGTLHGRLIATQQAFVVSEKNGRWRQRDRGARYGETQQQRLCRRRKGVNSISCAAVGECVAGGSYTDRRMIGRGYGRHPERAGLRSQRDERQLGATRSRCRARRH